MTRNRTVDPAEREAGSAIRLLPAPRPARVNLSSIDGCRLELARVYRGMKSGTIAPADGSRLCYVLVELAKLHAATDLERRLAALEAIDEREADHAA